MTWEEIKQKSAAIRAKVTNWFKSQEIFMSTAFKKYQKNIDPWTKHTYRFSIAFYTICAAYQACVTLIPWALSVGALFVTFPQFFFTLPTPLATLLFLGVSLVVGYFKYKNLLHQERLEQLVEEHEEKIHQLVKQIQELQPKVPVFTPAHDHVKSRTMIVNNENPSIDPQNAQFPILKPH
ncbi:MAG TPA: hypothetical protein VFP93_05020 [Gammaproteobacteria bacterium]|nr:hypothetical protein [Gammaproteobacteria bacterium]